MEKPQAEKTNTSYLSAMRMLARRDHSNDELMRKLSKKGYTPAEIALTLQQLIKEGLQSNSRFTQNYIAYRRAKGYGPMRIQAELLARGIPIDMIEHALDFTDNAWLAEARRLWQKRFKKGIPSDYAERAKQMRFLQYRGFTNDQINSIFHGDIEHA